MKDKDINQEIEKTFAEVDSTMGVMWSEIEHVTNLWKKVDAGSPDHQIKKEEIEERKKNIEIRLNHLFDNSQPALNDERRLSYSFYELKEMLTKVVNGLPNLFNEKGELNEDSLTLLTNFLAASKELENEKEEKEEQVIPTKEEIYGLLKRLENDETDSESDSDEVEWFENELKKEKLKNAKLRQELVSLKTAEEDRKNQLSQLKQKEQQTRNEIEVELALITLYSVSPDEPDTEQLAGFLTRLREMKGWLITGTDEQQKVIRDEYNHLKEILDLLKLKEKRNNVKQRIADVLADKEEVVLKKRVEVKKEELPDYKDKLQKERYRKYSRTLDEMYSSTEIIEFEKEILQVIAEQKQVYQTILESLSWGKKVIKSKDINQAARVRKILLDYRKLQLQQRGNSNGYSIFLNKLGNFHVLISDLDDLIKKQEIEKINKKSLSEQSIQEDKKALIEKIAKEFAEERLEGKTVEIIFKELDEAGTGAIARRNEDSSGFKIEINTTIEKENEILVFEILAHELGHLVILLKEEKDCESSSPNKLYSPQVHSGTFWKVLYDRDDISNKNDISTFEFVKNKLPTEYQKELGELKAENKVSKKNKWVRRAYFPNVMENLFGEMRRKKTLKTTSWEEAIEEWHEIRRKLFEAVDKSMNTPESEAEGNWGNLAEDLHKERRSTQIELWGKNEGEEESDRGSYKIFVYHIHDVLILPNLKNEFDKILITDDNGEWEGPIMVDIAIETKLKNWEITNAYKEEIFKKTTAQVLQLPKNTDKS